MALQFNTAGFGLVGKTLASAVGKTQTDARGAEFDPNVAGFSTKSGTAVPGENLEVRGLNDFLKATNDFQEGDQAFQNTINQVGLKDAVSAARTKASASFDTAEGVLARRQAGLGLNLSDRQKRAQKRRIGLGRAIADASSVRSVRQGFADRARGAAKAGLGLAEGIRGIEAGALIGLENAAGQEQIRAAQRKADKKESRNSLIGNIVGAGLSLLAIFSSEDYKHAKRPSVTEGSLLERLKKVRVEKWKYIGDETDHIGPYSEEFNEAFGVGEDNKQMINLGDAMGVLMGSIKELDAKVEARG